MPRVPDRLSSVATRERYPMIWFRALRPRNVLAIVLLLGSTAGLTRSDYVSRDPYDPDTHILMIRETGCVGPPEAPQECQSRTYNWKQNPYGPSVDKFIDMPEFCDIRDNMPISDECYGFIGGIVEVKIWDDLYAKEENWKHYAYACIPPKMTIAELFQKIRPYLRERGYACAGICDSASYVLTALNATFPCNQ